VYLFANVSHGYAIEANKFRGRPHLITYCKGMVILVGIYSIFSTKYDEKGLVFVVAAWSRELFLYLAGN